MLVYNLKRIPFSRLLISGGEPFLRNDLPGIINVFYYQNKISDIHLPTNGLLTKKIYKKTREIFEKCPNLKVRMSLPLDGMEKTNDILKGVKSAFKSTINTANCLYKLKQSYPNLTIGINTVVSNANCSEIKDLFVYVKRDLNMDYHGLDLIRGEPKDKTLRPVTAEQWQELTKHLSPYQKYYMVKNNASVLKQYFTSSFYRYIYKWYGRGLNKRHGHLNASQADQSGS